MAFNDEPGRAEYIAGAGQTIFPFSFKIYQDGDVKVYLTPSGQESDDAADLLVLTNDYTISINGDLGGTMTLVSGASVSDAITIVRELSITRLVEYQTSGDLLATTLNLDQSYQTYLSADLKAADTRFISIPASSQGINTSLPDPIPDAYLKWNSSADALENDTALSDNLIRSEAAADEAEVSAVDAAASAADAANSAIEVKDKIDTVDIIAEMLLLDPLINPNVNVLGYSSINDGGGGIFNYVSAQSAVNNGGTIIDGWVRQFSGAVNVKWFGVGTADDTVAFYRAHLLGDYYAPSGVYLFNATAANSLIVSEYDYGDAILKASILVKCGATLSTDGTATQFVITGAVEASSCGIAILKDTTTHSQKSSTVERHTMRLETAHGRYGIITPAETGIFANQRPKHFIDVHFAPPIAQDDKTIAPFGWNAGVLLGDSISSKIYITGYGTYNPTILDAGQHDSTALKAFAINGAAGIDVQLYISTFRTGFEISDGIEGFTFTNSEMQGVWYGVNCTNSGLEPGGFIDNVHCNANFTAYNIINRPTLQIGMVEAYRSDAYHNHGGEWNGINIDNSDITIDSIHTAHGTLLIKTSSYGVNATESTFICNSYQHVFLNSAFKTEDCTDCIVGKGTVLNVDNLYNLNGVLNNDFIGDDVTARAGVTNYFITDGNVDKKRLRFPNNSLLSVRRMQDIVISTDATFTVKPRETPTELYIAMTTGVAPYTYDVILDRSSAVVGDKAIVKVSGSTSTNPTVRISDNSTATILSTFNNITGAKRYVCEYQLNEIGVWVERSINESLELSF